MITEQQILELLPNSKLSVSNQIKSDCVFCGKGQHFFINRTTGLWKCHKCNEDGGIKTLLRHLGKLDLLEGNQLNVKHIEKKLITSTPKQEVPLSVLKTIKLPLGSELLSYANDTPETMYLKNRGLLPQDFEDYAPFKNTMFTRYEDYAMISVFQDFELKGFFGRYIYENSDYRFDPEKKRYENPKGFKFSRLLVGLDELEKQTETLIVVEGFFDKVSITNKIGLRTEPTLKCCSTGGKNFSDWQRDLVKAKTNIKNLVLWFDSRDAVNTIKKQGVELTSCFNVKACFEKTTLDPNLMSSSQILRILYKAEDIRNFSRNKVQFNVIK